MSAIRNTATIDGIKPDGARLSISLDDDLHSILACAVHPLTVREFIRERIATGWIKTSRDARRETLKVIVRPSLLNMRDVNNWARQQFSNSKYLDDHQQDKLDI